MSCMVHETWAQTASRWIGVAVLVGVARGEPTGEPARRSGRGVAGRACAVAKRGSCGDNCPVRARCSSAGHFRGRCAPQGSASDRAGAVAIDAVRRHRRSPLPGLAAACMPQAGLHQRIADHGGGHLAGGHVDVLGLPGAATLVERGEGGRRGMRSRPSGPSRGASPPAGRRCSRSSSPARPRRRTSGA